MKTITQRKTAERSIARLNFRLPAKIKKRVEDAAVLSGVTVSDFAVAALVSSADAVLRQQEERKLSDRDRDLFLNLLETPPKPNKALKKAAQKYKKVSG
ncbi:MAG: DUF1778 domain-containing protein [Acidobacteria bacterium]|nr:DUF1778 domain-containing protein [Acidobacteriota bacterium]